MDFYIFLLCKGKLSKSVIKKSLKLETNLSFTTFMLGNLPPPTTPEEVGARILQMERFVRGEVPVGVISFCLILRR